MIVNCIYNEPDRVPEGMPSQFNFGLYKHQDYLVMGITISGDQIWYLIDESGAPDFYPFQIFEIKDNQLDVKWRFKIINEDDDYFPFKNLLLGGYEELISDPLHYGKLIERNKEALHIYFQRKIEAEKRIQEMEHQGFINVEE